MLSQHIDTVLAFAMIMLLLSLLITAAVQFIVSLTGLRGRNLVWAVSELLTRVNPELASQVEATGDRAQEVTIEAMAKARELLSDPALAPNQNRILPAIDWAWQRWAKRPSLFGNTRRPPTEIQLEDLALMLDHMGVDVGVLEHGPDRVAAIEKKISKWFDLVMKAASERFKLRSRWVTVAGALILAFGYQVNSFDIIQRLSDQEVRAQVLDQLDEVQALYTTARRQSTETAELDQARDAVDEVLTQVYATRIVNLEAASPGEWFEDVPGKLATVLLLSLGAPFWYGAIGRIVGFRSALRRKKEPAETESSA